MKKNILIIVAITGVQISYAQNTYPWPSTGNIGIGTTSPRGVFDVGGNGDIYLSSSPNTGTAQSLFLPGHIFIAPYNGGNVSYLQARRADNSGSTQLQIRTYNNGSLVDAMLINSNGNIGIGTTSPSQKLEVNGNIQAGGPGGGFWQGFRSNGATGIWGFQQNDLMMVGIGGDVYTRGFSANAMGIFNGSTTKEDIYLYNQNSGLGDFIVLKNTGNVGIGTVHPTAKFSVKGDVLCTKLKVVSISNFPDYVFHSTYRLRPLSEVEQYIQQHHHLPEVPSAAEVEKDGLDLGDNQATLLKKIEELTLYLIEHDKIQQLQQKIIEQQRELLEGYRQRLDSLEKK